MRELRKLAAVIAVALSAAAATACTDASAAGTQMTVYATPTCGCCGAWVDHARENGFDVDVVYHDDLRPIRARHDIPASVTSCHFGVVDGYLVEGHVPANVVHRLLAERPDVRGIAVPGMPIGSPGMEHPSGLTESYEVVTFDESGPIDVYEFR